MRTTAGVLACTGIGVADCEGPVTVTIKLCATAFARGPVKFQIRLPEFLAPNAEAPSFASCSRSSARRAGFRAATAFSFRRCRDPRFGASGRGGEKDNFPDAR